MRLMLLGCVLLNAACLQERLGDGTGFGCERPVDCPSPLLCVAGLCQREGLGSAQSAVAVAAGEIACDPADPDFSGGHGTSKVCRMEETALLAQEQSADALLPLGSLQRSDGSRDKFQNAYALQWGTAALKAKSWPVPGVMEYLTPNAQGFFETFPQLSRLGEGKGYYSYDLGPWHVIALNSACAESSVGGCARDSAQGRWLAADLLEHPTLCTLAYFSAPRFSSAGNQDALQPLWEMLQQGGVDVVLSAGNPHYERFAPLNAQGQPDPTGGMRSFVVGTGGARLGNLPQTAAFSERLAVSFGVLRLDLRPTDYSWRFIAVADVPLDDRGGGSCH